MKYRVQITSLSVGDKAKMLGSSSRGNPVYEFVVVNKGWSITQVMNLETRQRRAVRNGWWCEMEVTKA